MPKTYELMPSGEERPRQLHVHELPRTHYLCVLRTGMGAWLAAPWPELRENDLIVFRCLDSGGRMTGEWVSRCASRLTQHYRLSHHPAVQVIPEGQPAYFARAVRRVDAERYFDDLRHAAARIL